MCARHKVLESTTCLPNLKMGYSVWLGFRKGYHLITGWSQPWHQEQLSSRAFPDSLAQRRLAQDSPSPHSISLNLVAGHLWEYSLVRLHWKRFSKWMSQKEDRFPALLWCGMKPLYRIKLFCLGPTFLSSLMWTQAYTPQPHMHKTSTDVHTLWLLYTI